MGYWLIIREILGVRDSWGPVFFQKADAELYARNEGCTQFSVEYWSVDGGNKHDCNVYLASTFVAKDDLFEFFGLYPTYEEATNALTNRFAEEQQLILCMTPV